MTREEAIDTLRVQTQDDVNWVRVTKVMAFKLANGDFLVVVSFPAGRKLLYRVYPPREPLSQAQLAEGLASGTVEKLYF